MRDDAAAERWAVNFLRANLGPHLSYHDLAHTAVDVLPAALQLATAEDVVDDEMGLLRVGACFHDIGHVVQFDEHEAIGVGIARAVLPSFGYSPDDVCIVVGLVMATRLPQRPRTSLERILADADLAVLGQETFERRNFDLRCELAASGREFSDAEWVRSQLAFIDSHRYHLASAEALWEARKQANRTSLTPWRPQ